MRKRKSWTISEPHRKDKHFVTEQYSWVLQDSESFPVKLVKFTNKKTSSTCKHWESWGCRVLAWLTNPWAQSLTLHKLGSGVQSHLQLQSEFKATLSCLKTTVVVVHTFNPNTNFAAEADRSPWADASKGYIVSLSQKPNQNKVQWDAWAGKDTCHQAW